ncbi:hypothetical protein Tco_0738611, partial [Tanacetum coccineum]
GRAEVLSVDTLIWKLRLLDIASLYTYSRLHAIIADTLILARDQLLPSGQEGERFHRLPPYSEICISDYSSHMLFMSEFVRMAAKFGAKIIPSGVVGEDDIGELIFFGMVLACVSLIVAPPLAAVLRCPLWSSLQKEYVVPFFATRIWKERLLSVSLLGHVLRSFELKGTHEIYFCLPLDTNVLKVLVCDCFLDKVVCVSVRKGEVTIELSFSCIRDEMLYKDARGHVDVTLQDGRSFEGTVVNADLILLLSR